MKRILLAFIVVLAVTGCVTNGGSTTTSETTEAPASASTSPLETTTETGARTTVATTGTAYSNAGGVIFVEIVEQPPENAPVQSLNESDANNPLLVEVLNEAIDANGSAEDLRPSQRDEMETTLSKLEEHEGNDSGYYVSYKGTVFRVYLAVNQ